MPMLVVGPNADHIRLVTGPMLKLWQCISRHQADSNKLNLDKMNFVNSSQILFGDMKNEDENVQMSNGDVTKERKLNETATEIVHT